jgi:hypothetical protein
MNSAQVVLMHQPNAGVGSEVIERVRYAIAYTASHPGETGAATANDVEDCGVEWARDLAATNRCLISGPYLGDHEEWGDYYLIHEDKPPPVFYSVIFMATRQQGPAFEREFAEWLDCRGPGFRVDYDHHLGLVRARFENEAFAQAFHEAHGGSLLTQAEARHVFSGYSDTVSPELAARSQRRSACATSTATPGT